MMETKLEGKLVIQATLTVKTGMHIGGSNDYAPIGAVDSTFIRDPFTKRPIIPGSSVKGKMRTLLAKIRNEAGIPKEPKDDETVVARLFGTTDSEESHPSRLQFSDSFIRESKVKEYEKRDMDTYLGEVKFENTINRGTGVANPRQIERVPAGMEFDFRLVYNIENKGEMKEDMEVLADGFRLLEMDYLGGHGSRGYGRIQFSDFSVTKWTLSGEETQEELQKIFEG